MSIVATLARSLSDRFPALTSREADVLARVAQGWSNADIAGDIGATEKTVKNVLLPVPFKVGFGEESPRFPVDELSVGSEDSVKNGVKEGKRIAHG